MNSILRRQLLATGLSQKQLILNLKAGHTMKYDNGKAPLALIPPEALEEISHVFGFGADKYGMNNWREDLDQTEWSRTYSSIQRHLNAFWSGQDIDTESGYRHLAHAATQLMILMTANRNSEMDDRWRSDNV